MAEDQSVSTNENFDSSGAKDDKVVFTCHKVLLKEKMVRKSGKKMTILY